MYDVGEYMMLESQPRHISMDSGHAGLRTLELESFCFHFTFPFLFFSPKLSILGLGHMDTSALGSPQDLCGPGRKSPSPGCSGPGFGPQLKMLSFSPHQSLTRRPWHPGPLLNTVHFHGPQFPHVSLSIESRVLMERLKVGGMSSKEMRKGNSLV